MIPLSTIKRIPSIKPLQNAKFTVSTFCFSITKNPPNLTASTTLSGLNARKGDAQALAQAIQAITSHPLVYERYTEGARKRFQEMFTLQHMIDNTLAIYTKHNA